MCVLIQQILSDSLLQNQHRDASCKEPPLFVTISTTKTSTLRGPCYSREYRPMQEYKDTTVSGWNNRPKEKESGTWGGRVAAIEATFSTAVSWSFVVEMNLLKWRIKEYYREAANVWAWNQHGSWPRLCRCGGTSLAAWLYGRGHTYVGAVIP